MTLRLFFMRHGETEWSLSGQQSGRADIPLPEHGEEEARQLGKRIRSTPFDHVRTSPLQRARHTCDQPAIELWNSVPFNACLSDLQITTTERT